LSTSGLRGWRVMKVIQPFGTEQGEKMDMQQAIERLIASGLKTCEVEWSGPSPRLWLIPASDLLAWLDDPVAYFAARSGVTSNEYMAAAEARYTVYCSARTTKGRPCRNVARAGYCSTPRQWVDMQGAMCPIHEERGCFAREAKQ
jgi:hypothetical protein